MFAHILSFASGLLGGGKFLSVLRELGYARMYVRGIYRISIRLDFKKGRFALVMLGTCRHEGHAFWRYDVGLGFRKVRVLIRVGFRKVC